MEHDLLACLSDALHDHPEVRVNRKLKDKGDRDLKLVDHSLLGQVSDELLARTARWVSDEPSGRADRAVGALVGLAVADWVGAPLEFLELTDEPSASRWEHDTFTCHNPNAYAIDRGILKPGQWTDDTSMALCLADSLIVSRGLHGSDLRVRFWCWYAEGMNNTFRLDPERSKRKSFGLGWNTAKSLMAMLPGEPVDPEYLNPGSSDSGNGGLMRLAPVPIFFSAPEQLESCLDAAARSSLATHPGPLATETARFLAFLVHCAINLPCEARVSARDFLVNASVEYATRLDDRIAKADGDLATLAELRALITSSKEGETERCWNWQLSSIDLAATFKARGEKYNGFDVSRCYAGSYCMDGLAMALFAVASTTSFHRCIERAVNFLGDADTVGAIAGQIAGAFYGFSSIDERYVAALRDWDRGEIPCRAALCFMCGRSQR